MNELKNILEQNLNDNFISAVLSNPRDEKLAAKVKVRPVLMKDIRVYQMETFRGNQAFHENLSADEACEKMLEAMENMKQMQLVTADAEFSVLISKKGKVTIKKKQKKAKMRPLDLKTDVIRKCNGLAKKYQYDKLTFLEGNIADYTGAEEVDMVVTLHACDTATDFALAKAIGWNAKVILSVPCCQHELNRQMKNDVLSPIMNYGLLKERMAALVTDGLRAEYLKREGYDVQVLEFIDMEHTPKNILLRAVKTGRRADNEESIRACESFLRVTPTLGRLLDEKGEL